MVKLSRWIIIIFLLGLLLACASARMAEEVQSAKATFNSGDFKQAFAELLPLAVKCSPEAQYAVGYMYYYGLGVEPHKESGLFWINLSAQQMYRPAIRALQVIERDKAEAYLPRKKSYKLRYSENNLSESLKDPELQKKIADVKKANNKVPEDPLHMAVKATPENKPEINEDDVIMSLKDLQPHPVAAKKPEEEPKKIAPKSLVKKEEEKPVKKEVVKAKVPVPFAKNKYTLQIFGSYKLDDVKQLQSRLKLQDKTHYALTQHNGRDWYILAYGKYPAVSKAKFAKNNMPQKAQKLNPWIRNTGELRWVG